MSDVTIYHNPACGTSRNTLALLREKGVEPTVVEYLKVGWTRPQLEDMLKRMGVSAHQILRAGAVLGHVAEQHVGALRVDGAHDAIDVMGDARLLDAEDGELAFDLVAAKGAELPDNDGQFG